MLSIEPCGVYWFATTAHLMCLVASLPACSRRCLMAIACNMQCVQPAGSCKQTARIIGCHSSPASNQWPTIAEGTSEWTSGHRRSQVDRATSGIFQQRPFLKIKQWATVEYGLGMGWAWVAHWVNNGCALGHDQLRFVLVLPWLPAPNDESWAWSSL